MTWCRLFELIAVGVVVFDAGEPKVNSPDGGALFDDFSFWALFFIIGDGLLFLCVRRLYSKYIAAALWLYLWPSHPSSWVVNPGSILGGRIVVMCVAHHARKRSIWLVHA